MDNHRLVREQLSVVMCVRTVLFALAALFPLGYSDRSKTRTGRTDNEYWEELASEELAAALEVKWNLAIAKNVVLFIGDGMGPHTVTATRIMNGGESHRLVYEKFPHIGSLKTYNADYMVPDSASTATAMFCGVKVNQRTIGVDASVPQGDCIASLNRENQLNSLIKLAMDAGKSTGFVTTMRVTHATPAPLYAHCPDRHWECEATMPIADTGAVTCKDIARQLIQDAPGRDINVIMGGGRQVLVSDAEGSESDPIDTWSCRRKDGRDLIADYKRDKEARNLKYSYVTNNDELENVGDVDYLLGIFANGHLKYDHERDRGPNGMPSISNMTEAAIRVLRKNKKGFFLMVEGGNIDMAHHRGKARKAISESAAMEAAVALAANTLSADDTLLIVTSDHTHGLSINGYPLRGSDIFGVVSQPASTGTNYTTLSYGTGGPGSFQYRVHNCTTVERRDPALEDTTSYEYEQLAAAVTVENYHGGGDVTVYARGPWSHLFHNVHEQHYVYHVISYAAALGQYTTSGAGAVLHRATLVHALITISIIIIISAVTRWL